MTAFEMYFQRFKELHGNRHDDPKVGGYYTIVEDGCLIHRFPGGIWCKLKPGPELVAVDVGASNLPEENSIAHFDKVANINLLDGRLSEL